MDTKIPDQYDFYIGEKNLTRLYNIILTEDNKMINLKSIINYIEVVNSDTKTIVSPDRRTVKKPNFAPARLSSENTAKYHARIKQQKLYIRAMQNGGANYVHN